MRVNGPLRSWSTLQETATKCNPPSSQRSSGVLPKVNTLLVTAQASWTPKAAPLGKRNSFGVV